MAPAPRIWRKALLQIGELKVPGAHRQPFNKKVFLWDRWKNEKPQPKQAVQALGGAAKGRKVWGPCVYQPGFSCWASMQGAGNDVLAYRSFVNLSPARYLPSFLFLNYCQPGASHGLQAFMELSRKNCLRARLQRVILDPFRNVRHLRFSFLAPLCFAPGACHVPPQRQQVLTSLWRAVALA